MAYTITIGGRDITRNVDQMSVVVHDTLGQGAGAGGASQGRSTTFEMMTNLGNISQAGGAGQPGHSSLLRQGEVTIYDQNGNAVFGGYATKFVDSTQYTLPFTKIEGIDYSTSLQRTTVNKVYSVATDNFIINDLLKTYAPQIDRSNLPNYPAYTFPALNLRNITLEAAIQKVSKITGYQFWVDFTRAAYYQPPSLNNGAPFSLSDNPNRSSSFSHMVEEYFIDDNAIVNRVTFYGGKRISNDTNQDVSAAANGVNKIFVAAWYMRGISTDNKIHVLLNGRELFVGNLVADQNDPFNTFQSQGGDADVLINSDARNITFDIPPPTGSTVTIQYRYQYPITVVVSDDKSVAYFGQYLDGTASDQTVFDTTTAVQRCKVILAEQSFGLTTLRVKCWKPGIQSGQSLKVVNALRGINGTYVVQEVTTTPLGGGNFAYEITLGAWKWNLIDAVLKLNAMAAPADLNTDEQGNPVSIIQALHKAASTSTRTTATTRTHGGNVLRADGATKAGYPDALIGLFTVTS